MPIRRERVKLNGRFLSLLTDTDCSLSYIQRILFSKNIFFVIEYLCNKNWGDTEQAGICENLHSPAFFLHSRKDSPSFLTFRHWAKTEELQGVAKFGRNVERQIF